MDRLEKAMKLTMLTVGIAGIGVIYFGFFYLQYNAELGMTMPWYFLISPWVCVYFGLSEQQQRATIAWFTRKFTAKK
ncbi:hypothetical protein [Shewanella sp. ENK2]|uniref:hypothetical protein n=1 Tax=Shewanella sp. ENK2 TaxID=2775245 RepID=UPI0037498335